MLLRADSRIFVVSFVILAGQTALHCERIAAGETRTADRPGLRAGAQAIDVSPRTFPVLINGGFLQNSATRVNDPLFARCLVLDDGTTRLAIVIVDSCMMPRELLDRAKEMAREKTGIATDRMLIAASGLATIFLGGRHDQEATFEGKIDEVAVYDRPLTPAEIVEHFCAAGEQFVHPDHW